MRSWRLKLHTGFFTGGFTGQRSWVEAMELDTLTPDLPQLLKEMGG
jgi:hypothetical protein